MPGARPPLIRHDNRDEQADGGEMKVLEGLSGGVEPGATIPVSQLGLPVKGANGLLLVFWKKT